MNTVPDSACGMRLLDLLDRQRIGPEAVLYSLIDGAKHAVSPEDPSIDMFSLLGDAAQSDAVWAGPILIRHARGKHCPQLAKLLCTAGSASFLSLIESNLPLEILLKRLTWLCDVRHEDGTEWVMRYYDPLILPHWLGMLDSPQRLIALRGIEAWWYVDVRGQPQVAGRIEAGVPGALASDPMLLSDAQCDKLIELTAPYFVISELENDDANVIDAMACHERYDFFAKQLARAHEYGLTSMTDLKTYCLLAVMYGPTFDQHPAPAAALGGSRTTLAFSAQILAWGAEHWASLAALSHAGTKQPA